MAVREKQEKSLGISCIKLHCAKYMKYIAELKISGQVVSLSDCLKYQVLTFTNN